jgi:hypothetical protein
MEEAPHGHFRSRVWAGSVLLAACRIRGHRSAAGLPVHCWYRGRENHPFYGAIILQPFEHDPDSLAAQDFAGGAGMSSWLLAATAILEADMT